MAKKKKIRVDLRKNLSKPPRERGWTRGFEEHGYEQDATHHGERVRARGNLSRKRTMVQDDTPKKEGEATGAAEMPAIDINACLPGRVLRVHRLNSIVETDDGRIFRCATRQLLRSLAIDDRSIVTTGDRVWIRPSINDEGFIERVEPRHGVLTRASRRQQQVLVANVDQVVFVVSLINPELKPHLVDRFLASAYQGGIQPVICLNKVDLTDPVAYQPLVGLYSQLGILTYLTSATTGQGVERLRDRIRNRQTVFTGQSGVGKSSLLNALQPELGLRVREVSEVNNKGKHTTTNAELIKLDFGGWVVDTPGLRQFELWDMRPEEMEGFFPELRPFVTLCGFPDCTHTHEENCAVKRAVLRRQISATRYTSYLGLFAGEST